MTTLNLELTEHLAHKLAGAAPDKIREALEIGLEMLDAGSEIQPTEHPHITRITGILGGRPIIRGSRIPVWQVANAVVHLGETVEDYLAGHPHLTAAQIYDALSYYFDHHEAVEKEIEENRMETVVKELGLTMDERGLIKFTS
jgi:uncharacterized protein (DUF433 family)